MEEKKDKKKYKRNYVKTYKNNFKKGSFNTNFFLNINSKAIFKLSEQGLKLYILLILNGKSNPPNIRTFASRMKKSERTISRIMDELKEHKFLKVNKLGPKTYEYVFDPNGNLDKMKEEKFEKEFIQKPIEEDSKELEIIENETDLNIDLINKTKTFTEYEDFAILSNVYWKENKETQKEIKKIIEDRLTVSDPATEVLKWFLDKITIFI